MTLRKIQLQSEIHRKKIVVKIKQKKISFSIKEKEEAFVKIITVVMQMGRRVT